MLRPYIGRGGRNGQSGVEPPHSKKTVATPECKTRRAPAPALQGQGAASYAPTRKPPRPLKEAS